jgi:hypothetical protein
MREEVARLIEELEKKLNSHLATMRQASRYYSYHYDWLMDRHTIHGRRPQDILDNIKAILPYL